MLEAILREKKIEQERAGLMALQFSISGGKIPPAQKEMLIRYGYLNEAGLTDKGAEAAGEAMGLQE